MDLIKDLTKQKAALRNERLKMLSRVSDSHGNLKKVNSKIPL